MSRMRICNKEEGFKVQIEQMDALERIATALEQIAKGGLVHVSQEAAPVRCTECHGSGKVFGTHKDSGLICCSVCKGSGRL